MDRMKRLTEAIRLLIEGGFSGYLRINFSQGSLGRIEKFEEIDEAALTFNESVRTAARKQLAEEARSQDKETSLTSQIRKSSLSLMFCLLMLPPALSLAAGPDSVKPGGIAQVRYTCLLKGEIVAATGNPDPMQPKSNIFVMTKEPGVISVAAALPEATLTPTHEPAFEEEIADRLAAKIGGMKAGESRRVELVSQNIPQRDEKNFVVRIAKVRTRPKELIMTIEDYKAKTQKAPEAGQLFIIDPAFPGKIASVTDKEVVIKFPKPADLIQTPFGTGRVSEEGPNYRVVIDARKGALTRMGGMIGRIVAVDDKSITIDYRNPFGGETLICDVTVEKVAEEKPVASGKGE